MSLKHTSPHLILKGTLPDFPKNTRQGYRTFLKLSGKVIELFKNSSPKLPVFFKKDHIATRQFRKKTRVVTPTSKKIGNPPPPYLPHRKKIDRTDQFQNRSGRPPLFQFFWPAFPLEFQTRMGGRLDRTHELVGPTDPIHGSGRPVIYVDLRHPLPPRLTFSEPGAPPPTTLSKRGDYPPIPPVLPLFLVPLPTGIRTNIVKVYRKHYTE